jgi:hypothetical protein
MHNPYVKLKILKDAPIEEIVKAQLKAAKGKTEAEKKIIHEMKNELSDKLERSKIDIHCLNIPIKDLLINSIKKSISPW